jgi:predicted nucleotidyltransferase
LVDFDLGGHGALPLIRLRCELGQLLGEHVDVVTAELIRPEVAARVATEAVPL